jgi:glycosyltransferase involved in cell wall biosynthesis
MNKMSSNPTPAPASTTASMAAGRGRILIVTPTLGTSSYLDETVRGVNALTVPFLHVFVTPAPMVASLQARYPDAMVLADAGKAAGLYGAINVALDSAGEDWQWFTYINDDDELGPDFDQMAREHFARPNPEPVVYGDVRIIDDDGKTISFLPLERDLLRIPPLLRAGISPLNQQGMLFHRSVVNELKAFDIRYRICADLDFWARALAAGYGFRNYRLEVGRFRIRRGQISGDVKLTVREQDEIARRLFPAAGGALPTAWAKLWFRLKNLRCYAARIRQVGWYSSEQLLAGAGRDK